MPPKGHSVLSPSSAVRWIACPPSALDNANAERKDTIFTREGTLAHELAEIKAGIATGLYIPDAYADALERIRADELYTEEMERCTDRYVEVLLELKAEFLDEEPQVRLETKLDMGQWAPGCFGTADCVIFGMDSIYVVDLKYGKGVPVDATENRQMMIYALGVYARYGDLFGQENIKTVIIQPRIAHDPSEWEIRTDDLLDWAENVLRPAAELAIKGEGARKMGDHCRWCCNNGNCKAQLDEFADLPVETDPNLLTSEQVAKALELAPLLDNWFEAIKSNALNRALDGNPPDGWKAVEGRSTRSWRDQDGAFAAAIENGIPEAMLYERKALSVAALEKVVGKKNFNTLLGSFVDKAPGKPTLAKASDKRDAITRKTAIEDDFE